MRTQATLLSAALAAALLAPGVAAWAQNTQTVPLGQRAYEIFDLSPSSPLRTVSLPMGRATQLVIDVTSKGAPVGVSITNPLGVALDPATFARFAVTAANASPLGAVLLEEGEHVQAVVASPPAGTWTVSVTLPAGAPAALGSITALASGGLAVGATTSRGTYQAGDVAVLALLAFDGTAPLTGAIAAANLYQTGGENAPLSVPLRDDGADPDAEPGDGVYTAGIEGLLPGHYLAEVVLQAGAERATATADFEVVARLAHFNGGKSDAGLDTNGDGLFDFIRVDLGVAVDTPGSYDVFAELRPLTGAAAVRAGARATLAAGTQTVSLRFAAADIRTLLAVDGPWQVRDARLVKLSTDGSSADVLADRAADLGPTSAYTLAQLQRPVTLILPGISEQGLDTNGNGLFDLLKVSFGVDTRQAGLYTWTGDLRAPDGTVFGIASGQGFLAAGVSSLGFSFDGRPIGASGLDGPYTVGNVAVYGPIGAAAVAAEVGRTRAYSATEFEGGQVTFARLIEVVQGLIVTGPGGIPRAQGIRTSLLHKAQNAQAQAERGNANAARNLLDAFINEVQAQAGVHIAPDDAQRLVDLATRLRNSL